MKMMNRLIALLVSNRSAPRQYRIAEAAADSNEASMFLYDVIGYDFWSDGGVTAKQFSADLRALGDKTLHLHVNSPGGDVMDGRAMVAALQAYPGKVIAHVDGLAASAASFLVMHADEIVMTEGSFMMIHNGWTLAVGDRHAFRETADLLQKIDGSIADDYLTRTNATREEVAAWMDAETWFTAQEALDAGLCNSIAEARGGKGGPNAKAKGQWNLDAYEHPPEELAASNPAPEPAAPPVPPEPDHETAHAHRMRRLALVDTALA